MTSQFHLSVLDKAILENEGFEISKPVKVEDFVSGLAAFKTQTILQRVHGDGRFDRLVFGTCRKMGNNIVLASNVVHYEQNTWNEYRNGMYTVDLLYPISKG